MVVMARPDRWSSFIKSALRYCRQASSVSAFSKASSRKSSSRARNFALEPSSAGLLDWPVVALSLTARSLWRSEERRVGKEGRLRWAADHEEKKGGEYR